MRDYNEIKTLANLAAFNDLNESLNDSRDLDRMMSLTSLPFYDAESDSYGASAVEAKEVLSANGINVETLIHFEYQTLHILTQSDYVYDYENKPVVAAWVSNAGGDVVLILTMSDDYITYHNYEEKWR